MRGNMRRFDIPGISGVLTGFFDDRAAAGIIKNRGGGYMSFGVSENDVKRVSDYISMFSSLTFKNVAIGLAVLVLGLIAVRLIVRALGKVLERAKALPPAIQRPIKSTVRVVLDIVVILTATSAMGIPITSFVAVLSVIALAVTLAVQNILNNVVGGFIIAVSHPFSMGDFVQMDDVTGTVEEVKLMYTRFLAPDGRIIYVPNKNIYTANLINYTRNGRRRVELSVSASYDSEPEKVAAAIRDALSRIPGVLADPEPVIHLESYGDSAIAYTFYFWVAAKDFWGVKYAVNEELYGAFRRGGVEMTYPHMNVHMKD